MFVSACKVMNNIFSLQEKVEKWLHLNIIIRISYETIDIICMSFACHLHVICIWRGIISCFHVPQKALRLLFLTNPDNLSSQILTEVSGALFIAGFCMDSIRKRNNPKKIIDTDVWHSISVSFFTRFFSISLYTSTPCM